MTVEDSGLILTKKKFTLQKQNKPWISITGQWNMDAGDWNLRANMWNLQQQVSSLSHFPSDHTQYWQWLLTGTHLVSPTPSWVDAIGLRWEEVPVRRARVSSSSLSSGIDLAVMLWQGRTLTYGSFCSQPDTGAHTVNNDEYDFSIFLFSSAVSFCLLCSATGLPTCFCSIWVAGPGKFLYSLVLKHTTRDSQDEIPLLNIRKQTK